MDRENSEGLELIGKNLISDSLSFYLKSVFKESPRKMALKKRNSLEVNGVFCNLSANVPKAPDLMQKTSVPVPINRSSDLAKS